MKVLTTALLLLAVISVVTSAEKVEHRELVEEVVNTTETNDKQNVKINVAEVETNIENKTEVLEGMMTDETSEKPIENNVAESENEAEADIDEADDEKNKPKIFTITNQQLHELPWNLFIKNGTTTTTYAPPTRYTTYYPTHRPTTTKRPHQNYPSYPLYPAFPTYPHFPPYPPPPPLHRPPHGPPHRPAYPPFWPPYGFPPYGYPPIPPYPRPPTSTTTTTTTRSPTKTTRAPNQRRKPQRKRRPTQPPYSETAYKDFIESLKPLIAGQNGPILLALGNGQKPLDSSTNIVFNPATNQLTPLTSGTKPLYIQTSISSLPHTDGLSLSTSLSSASHHSSIVSAPNTLAAKPIHSAETHLTRIEASTLNSAANQNSTVPTNLVASTPAISPAGNESFCAVFSWICDSNSKIKVAQLENAGVQNSPLVVLLVQPPPPTQVTYMKSAN